MLKPEYPRGRGSVFLGKVRVEIAAATAVVSEQSGGHGGTYLAGHLVAADISAAARPLDLATGTGPPWVGFRPAPRRLFGARDRCPIVAARGPAPARAATALGRAEPSRSRRHRCVRPMAALGGRCRRTSPCSASTHAPHLRLGMPEERQPTRGLFQLPAPGPVNPRVFPISAPGASALFPVCGNIPAPGAPAASRSAETSPG